MWWNIFYRKPAKPMPEPANYKGVTFEDATFPYDRYRILPITLNPTIRNEYLPALERALPDSPKGLKLLITAMTHAEGFRPGTRSHRFNNPGNIGNTDSGANKGFKTLEDGIRAQAEHIKKIVDGKSNPYPIGKLVVIPPFFSQEIQNNLKNYGAKSGYVPGYRFLFTGQLDQFLKIYATLPRISNSYVNIIVSYFFQNGVEIKPTTTLGEIIGEGL